MKYTEKTTLFNLDKIDYNALGKKNQESKKSFKIDLTFLSEFLSLLKKESMISNKSDFPIEFIVEISGRLDPSCSLTFSTEGRLLPHLNFDHTTYQTFIRTHDTKNEVFTAEKMFSMFCSNYIGFVSNSINLHHCKSDFGFILKSIRKIDSLLCCDNELYDKIFSHGFYKHTTKMSLDTFHIDYSLNHIQITSKAVKKINHQSFFSMYVSFSNNDNSYNVNKTAFKLHMYGQEISLNYEEFMNASNNDIEQAIILILQLKKINISNISDLKNELLLQEMMNI